MPPLADIYTERVIYEQQRTGAPATRHPGPPGTDGRERGVYPGRVGKSSVETSKALRPGWTAAAATALAAGWALVRRSRGV